MHKYKWSEQKIHRKLQQRWKKSRDEKASKGTLTKFKLGIIFTFVGVTESFSIKDLTEYAVNSFSRSTTWHITEPNSVLRFSTWIFTGNVKGSNDPKRSCRHLWAGNKSVSSILNPGLSASQSKEQAGSVIFYINGSSNSLSIPKAL